jgi:phage terminase large subunit
MKNLILEGNPQPAQIPFFEATARHIGYGGARGGGKSWAMRRKFVLLAVMYANLKLLLLRRTLPELEGNHIQPLMKELYKFATYTSTKHIFTFPNGSTIKCGYCDTEADTLQFQGQEYDVIGLEEATHFTEKQRQDLLMCNRGVRSDGFTPRMYYTFNPGGVGHNWVKRLFIDRDYTEEENPDDYVFFQARVYDNPALMQADPGYVKQLETLPPERRRAMLDGDWDVLEGQYFEEFRRSKHVVEPFNIPPHWKRFRSIDWGFNDPCCVLWYALAPDGRIYAYDEIYQRQTLARDMAKLIREKTGLQNVSYTIGSPDMWQNRGLRGFLGENIAEELTKSGVPVIKADNARVLGWQRVRYFLSDALDGKPWLQVFSTCKNLIRTFPLAIYDKNDKEDVSGTCEDHALESLRYGLMSRPIPNKIPIQQARVLPFDPLSTPKRVERGFLSLGG